MIGTFISDEGTMYKFAVLGLTLLSLLTLPSCRRSTDEVMNDTRTATRHVKRGVFALGGKHSDSRQFRSRDELYGTSDSFYQNDFIPLGDVEFGNESVFADASMRQPKNCPGDPGSSIPGIEAFYDPCSVPELASTFRNISFEYDSNLIRGEENMARARKIAAYLRSHPNAYVFVEGHCDERGGEAYNLALGAKRSNAVRTYLIQEGVSPDNVFTISYGRERPLVVGNSEKAWSQNRRAEFKIYFQR